MWRADASTVAAVASRSQTLLTPTAAFVLPDLLLRRCHRHLLLCRHLLLPLPLLRPWLPRHHILPSFAHTLPPRRRFKPARRPLRISIALALTPRVAQASPARVAGLERRRRRRGRRRRDGGGGGLAASRQQQIAVLLPTCAYSAIEDVDVEGCPGPAARPGR